MKNSFDNKLEKLKIDLMNVQKKFDVLCSSSGKSPNTVEKAIDEFMTDIEKLCVCSRIYLDCYRLINVKADCYTIDDTVSKVAGSVEITHDGWLHITLNTLLPSCKYKTSGYIGDTVCRLVSNFDEDLPYFDKAFLAIVEHCNYENHNSLDNDNKAWKEIPNALKGRVIPDDNQFILSLGLFSKLSDEARCEIYLMPSDEANIFMDLYLNDML